MTLKYEDFLGVIGQAEDKGRYILGLCPFHNDSTPSLLVYKDGWWRCLGCNKNGRWITLWNKVKGQPIHITTDARTSWNSPVRGITDLENLCYEAHLSLTEFPSLQWYIEMRGLEGRIDPNELGYHEGWYTIPVLNNMGEFETCVFRAAPHVQEVTRMKYWCNHKPMMFVPDWRLYENSDYLFVVFGIFDALALADLRFPVVTSTSGKDTFQYSWLDAVRKPIYIVPDSGEEETGLRLAGELGWRGKLERLVYPSGKKDASGFLECDQKENLITQLENIHEK
jgi:CHC2 zinc finger